MPRSSASAKTRIPNPGVEGAAAPSSAARRFWQSLTGMVGAVVGLAPHVLHHVGLLAGTALVAGSGGTALFAVLGFLASVPMLVRLRRRFGSWRAPAIAFTGFVLMFSLSAFVIGPRISGRSGDVKQAPVVDHNDHGH
ncbi:MAG: hypothetical protein ABIM89_16450 [Mycobacteriales bacterium]